ncbi:hypothetical protein [Longimicrobium sp.]|uniref:hypothetical protein n=1 Tax=Longimicrobium sp. TaxID=2029185 RepID=UPI002C7508A6|nr:hypothetical protein [Longimicrobium sp.]HSU16502.1 hypothetical protein [Longimicrobium sp.]
MESNDPSLPPCTCDLYCTCIHDAAYGDAYAEQDRYESWLPPHRRQYHRIQLGYSYPSLWSPDAKLLVLGNNSNWMDYSRERSRSDPSQYGSTRHLYYCGGDWSTASLSFPDPWSPPYRFHAAVHRLVALITGSDDAAVWALENHVLVSNASPYCTSDFGKVEGYAPGHTERLWRRWLPRLRPEVIVCLGRESDRLMRALFRVREAAGPADWRYKWFDATHMGQPVRVAAMRHPGWYWANARSPRVRSALSPALALMDDMGAMVQGLGLGERLGEKLTAGFHWPGEFEAESLADVRLYYHQHRRWPEGLDEYLQQLSRPRREPGTRRRRAKEG